MHIYMVKYGSYRTFQIYVCIAYYNQQLIKLRPRPITYDLLPVCNNVLCNYVNIVRFTTRMAAQ